VRVPGKKRGEGASAKGSEGRGAGATSGGSSGAGTTAGEGGAGDDGGRPPTSARTAAERSKPSSRAERAGRADGSEQPDGRASATSAGERSVRAANRGEVDVVESDAAGRDGTRARRRRELLRLPFRAMTAVEIDECEVLVRALAERVRARVRRRLAPRPTGRLDFRRTIRAAVSRGGVPFERRYRGRRPGAPDLVALCDLSASTATASRFFLTLLTPAATYFRRVALYGYVDRLIPIEFVEGHVRPAGPLDVMARSDFGRVLRDLVETESAALGADTVLLVLGDARNNRRPPRADLLAAARMRVRRLLWLNPDAPERWNTGDSVIDVYGRHADAVVACGTLGELDRALAAVATL
jgi:uncharacterized protein with von Willebrand factor type A (vWA) domain